MATNDSGIPDTCLYMEAFSGDGGVHTDSSAQYWLSPDVIMTTTGDTGAAIVGANTTQVTVHCNAATDKVTCPSKDNEGGATTVVFELYVGTPSLFLGNPSNLGPYLTNYVAQIPIVSPAQPVQVNSSPPGVITAGGKVSTPVSWTATGTANDPMGVGHKCLVARCYPFETSSPDGGINGLTSHLPNDPHYAQHNLNIVTSEGAGIKKIPIRTANPFDQSQLVSFQAVFDPQPNRYTLSAILPSLQATRGFKQIATTPLRSVEFDLSAFNGAHESLFDKIEDALLGVLNDLEAKCRQKGGVAVRKVLPPHFGAFFSFNVDTTGAAPGDAHVYHLTETGVQGDPGGGITVILMQL